MAGERIIDVLDAEDQSKETAKDDAKARKAEKSAKPSVPTAASASASASASSAGPTPSVRGGSKTPREQNTSRERDPSQERKAAAASKAGDSSLDRPVSAKARAAGGPAGRAPLSSGASRSNEGAAGTKEGAARCAFPLPLPLVCIIRVWRPRFVCRQPVMTGGGR